jgi:hypothetical protein
MHHSSCHGDPSCYGEDGAVLAAATLALAATILLRSVSGMSSRWSSSAHRLRASSDLPISAAQVACSSAARQV